MASDTDTHSGSRRADVWDELRRQTTDRIPNAATELAAVRKQLDSILLQEKLLFQRYEDVKAILEDGGIVAQFKLPPILDAAHGAWLRDRETPRRLELSEIREAPIPPEDAA
jgi:hypothetical protein